MNDLELRALIAKYLKLRVRTNADVIKAVRMARSTYYRKLSHPEEFNLGELRAIFNYLKIPTTERCI